MVSALVGSVVVVLSLVVPIAIARAVLEMLLASFKLGQRDEVMVLLCDDPPQGGTIPVPGELDDAIDGAKGGICTALPLSADS
jgi:hypothetical protein